MASDEKKYLVLSREFCQSRKKIGTCLLFSIYLYTFISANTIQLFSQKKKAEFWGNIKHCCRFEIHCKAEPLLFAWGILCTEKFWRMKFCLLVFLSFCLPWWKHGHPTICCSCTEAARTEWLFIKVALV